MACPTVARESPAAPVEVSTVPTRSATTLRQRRSTWRTIPDLDVAFGTSQIPVFIDLVTDLMVVLPPAHLRVEVKGFHVAGPGPNEEGRDPFLGEINLIGTVKSPAPRVQRFAPAGYVSHRLRLASIGFLLVPYQRTQFPGTRTPPRGALTTDCVVPGSPLRAVVRVRVVVESAKKR